MMEPISVVVETTDSAVDIDMSYNPKCTHYLITDKQIEIKFIFHTICVILYKKKTQQQLFNEMCGQSEYQFWNLFFLKIIIS